MEPEIKRWTAKCKAELVKDIIKGKTTAKEGDAVSISQLCRWTGLARSTFYY